MQTNLRARYALLRRLGLAPKPALQMARACDMASLRYNYREFLQAHRHQRVALHAAAAHFAMWESNGSNADLPGDRRVRLHWNISNRETRCAAQGQF